MQLLHRGSHFDHFLHELCANDGRQQASTGAGEENPIPAGCKIALRLHAGQKFQDHLRLARVVALVVPPTHFAAVHQCGFYGGGTHVHPDELHDDGVGSGIHGAQTAPIPPPME